MSLPTLPTRTQPGDLVGIHPNNTAGANPNHTYRLAAPPNPDGSLTIWHADPTHPHALDWATTIRPADIRYLIRTTARGITTWRCDCCHPHPATTPPDSP
ncbi:DUF6211 family protein [Polymorphospora sp. NPDC050346]|uniref:DUF6211 family protein n=1 Tax=Polymorphospora sp. NPDC050346 TaxID=3155780 RepID=UPI0033DCB32B